MKKLYLAGAMFGLDESESRGWREEAKHRLAGHYECLDPMRRDYRGRELEHAAEIVEQDLADIRASDALLVMAERPSWGTACEMYQARLWGKTIVSVCSGRVAPWLSYHSTRVCGSLDEAIRCLVS
jgi:nucleoside 2-deoxyribosyltransferase